MTLFFILTNLSFIFFSVDQESRLVLYDKTFKVDTQPNTAITLWYVENPTYPKSTNSVERANAELKRGRLNNLETFNHFFEPHYNCRTVFCHVHQNK